MAARLFAGAALLVSALAVPTRDSAEPAMPLSKTAGMSVLGNSMPEWLGNSPMPKGRPWADRTANNTNPFGDPPVTGVTRHYNFTITQQEIAPDGVSILGLVINGAFPGPTITANWGDWIEVQVTNNLPTEGTALHWHGLLQKETPWFDGVPSVQQCPIAPGSTFTYRFRADLYGTSWYHSHYSAQYAGGLLGPMIIFGPHDNAQYDEDLGPVLINDWYHKYYFDIVEQVMAPASQGLPPPRSNNNLINGKMNYPCANATAGLKCVPNAGVSKFSFVSGKTYRLRLINAGAEGIQKFSIDGYKLMVIANDFVPVVPYEVDVVTMGVGQRTDVVVTAKGSPTDAVWMRSVLGPCTLNDGVSPVAMAAIYYQNADTSKLPNTTSSVSAAEIANCNNDPLANTVPAFSMTPTMQPAKTQDINITLHSNGTNNLFFMNNSTFRADYNDPTLLEVKLGKTQFPAMSNVFDFGTANSVRLIVYNFAAAGVHPMHFHGHNFWVLATGTGTWDGVVTNPNNPQRRDVQLLPNSVSPTEPGYIVLQYDADNPGVWPFHCHIAWHVSAGLYVNLLEHPSNVTQEMQIPSIMAQTCRDWSAWTGDHIPDEIDSGL